MSKVTQEDGNPLYIAGIPLGGLVLGLGVVSLYWSFGLESGELLNQNISSSGWTALDNLSLLPAADYSVGLVVLGVALLVFLNATAWRRTSGY